MGCPCARKTHPRQDQQAAADPQAAPAPAGYRHPDRGNVWQGPERVAAGVQPAPEPTGD